MTDAQGHKVDFRNTAVIMTSNIGAKSINGGGQRRSALRRQEPEKRRRAVRCGKAAVIAELRRTFRPEFLNRVDETIVFRRLSREDCAEIARAGCLRDRFPRRGARHHARGGRGLRGLPRRAGLRRFLRRASPAAAHPQRGGGRGSRLAFWTARLQAATRRFWRRKTARSACAGGRKRRPPPSATSVRRRREKRDASDRRPDRWMLIGRVFHACVRIFCGRMMRGLFALEGMKPAWQTGSC